MSSAPFAIEGIAGMVTHGRSPRPGATIFLHGGPGGTCQTTYPFFPAERLSGTWYFPDLPNHGRSEGTGGDWSPEACVAKLDTFAQRLEGPLRVAGLSWGTNVAVEWAATRPERFRCVLGVSGAGNVVEVAKHQEAVVAGMPPEIHALMAQLADATGDAVRQVSAALWEATLPFWMAGNPGLEVYQEGTRGFASDPRASAAYLESWLLPHLNPGTLRARFDQLPLPTLLIRGLDDRMGNERCAMDFYIDAPNVNALLLEDAGHCPFVDQPDRFFEAVEAFFDRVDGAPQSG
jgi:proline iminopeptidase